METDGWRRTGWFFGASAHTREDQLTPLPPSLYLKPHQPTIHPVSSPSFSKNFIKLFFPLPSSLNSLFPSAFFCGARKFSLPRKASSPFLSRADPTQGSKEVEEEFQPTHPSNVLAPPPPPPSSLYRRLQRREGEGVRKCTTSKSHFHFPFPSPKTCISMEEPLTTRITPLLHYLLENSICSSP